MVNPSKLDNTPSPMKPSMGPKNHTQVVVVYYLPPLWPETALGWLPRWKRLPSADKTWFPEKLPIEIGFSIKTLSHITGFSH